MARASASGLHDLVQAPFPMGSLAVDQERRLVFDSVTSFLADSAGPGGLLLLLDDLQWAGSDGLDLMAAVLRSAIDIGLRVVGAYRDTDLEPGHPLSTALADLTRGELVRMTPVTELPEEDAGQLLDSLIVGAEPVDNAVKHDIIQRSDGVPFFLVSYAEGIRSGVHATSAQKRVPWGLSHSIRQRITSMPEDTQEIIGAAAVIGRDASVSLLAAVVDQSEEAVLRALTPAWRTGLLEEADDRTYRFAHDAIREVAEADLEAPRRMLLHRRIAVTLEALPEYRDERRASVLASHFTKGDLLQRAFPYAITAGDQAELVFAHAEAERCFRMALEIARVSADGKAQAEALAKLGRVLAEAGQRTEARALLAQASKVYRASSDVEGEARTAAWMTGVLETPQEGIARITELLYRVDRSGSVESQARLREVLAYLLGVAGNDRESLEMAERASQLAGDAGDEQLLWRSESLRGRALIELGRVPEGLDTLEVMIVSARTAGDINEISGLSYAASGYVSRGRLATAWAHLQRALQLSEGYGSPLAHAHALGELSCYLALICQWENVEECLNQLESIIQSVDLQWEEPVALGLMARGQLHIARGEWDQAGLALDDSLLRVLQSGETRMLAPLLQAQSEMDLLHGDYDQVSNRIVPALEGGAISPRHSAALLSLLAWSYLEVGRYVDAESVATRAVAAARRHGMALHLVDALCVRGLVETYIGGNSGTRTLKTAARLARLLRYDRGEARAQLTRGTEAAARGRKGEALSHFEAALLLFRRLRLQPYVARTESAIRSLQD